MIKNKIISGIISSFLAVLFVLWYLNLSELYVLIVFGVIAIIVVLLYKLFEAFDRWNSSISSFLTAVLLSCIAMKAFVDGNYLAFFFAIFMNLGVTVELLATSQKQLKTQVEKIVAEEVKKIVKEDKSSV